MVAVATQLTPRQISLIDLNTNYNVNAEAFLLFDVKAINNQLFNLFTVDIGEADYEPEYGSVLPNRLFDLMPGTRAQLESDLFIALNRWMSDKIIITPTSVRAIPNFQIRAYDVLIRYALRLRDVVVDYGIRIPLVNQER